MARKIEIKEYRDWQDVDNALRRMGEIDIKLSDLEGKMTLKINEIREEFDTKAEGLKAERRSWRLRSRHSSRYARMNS